MEMFDNLHPDHWEDHWIGMPEFIQKDKEAIKQVTLNFEKAEDIELFNKTTGLSVTMETKGVFFPEVKSRKISYIQHD